MTRNVPASQLGGKIFAAQAGEFGGLAKGEKVLLV